MTQSAGHHCPWAFTITGKSPYSIASYSTGLPVLSRVLLARLVAFHERLPLSQSRSETTARHGSVICWGLSSRVYPESKPYAKPAGRVRIAVTGASSVLGCGVVDRRSVVATIKSAAQAGF